MEPPQLTQPFILDDVAAPQLTNCINKGIGNNANTVAANCTAQNNGMLELIITALSIIETEPYGI